MSERGLQRVEVLGEVPSGRRGVGSAALVLALSERQVWRLPARYKAGGGGALVHRGRALELVRSRYGDFGPTLAAEMLRDTHGLTVSREMLRQWMAEAGLWLSRRQRRQFHPPRLRRERCGELIQIEGSEHRWFEDRADPCTLLVFIDDATGRLMQLRFAVSEFPMLSLRNSAEMRELPLRHFTADEDRRLAMRAAKAEALRKRLPDRPP